MIDVACVPVSQNAGLTNSSGFTAIPERQGRYLPIRGMGGLRDGGWGRQVWRPLAVFPRRWGGPLILFRLQAVHQKKLHRSET